MATSPIADQVGRVLGDRYRLLRPVGTGASAHVYVAEDVALRRRVAVKLLHPALADDEAFLRRFRAEAQAVAALRHPNIVRVYDWGEDGGSPYLVTELLEGGSLRALLDAGRLLSPAQAAAVGADVARALAYAHRRGLVHRDVKPANLIFDDEGRVSVADFGLARALAEASWTEPAGAVLGTARYAAPEQLGGQVLDDRADVYSLAVVLVEAATGEVPFAADTTIGTLMGRIDRPLPVPDFLGPLTPVLAGAGQPDPAGRPNATRLAEELDRVAAQLPPASAVPIIGPNYAAVADFDRHPTDLAVPAGAAPGARPGTAAGSAPDQPAPDQPAPDQPAPTQPAPDQPAPDQAALDHAALDQPAPTQESAFPPVSPPAASPPLPPAAAPPAASPPAAPAPPLPAGAPDSPPGRRRRWRQPWVLGAAAAALLLVAGVAAFLTLRPPPLKPVPRLVGDTRAQAAAALRPLHLRVAVAGRSYDQDVAAGRIVSQRPAGGRLREGQAVSVTVSLGPPPIAVPDLNGRSEAQAAAALAAAHLSVGHVSTQASTTISAGTVMAWSHQGATVAQGTPVDLVVSSGLPVVSVPSLVGTAASTFAGARSALAAAGLGASESQAYSDTVPAGQVISTDPGPGASVRLHTTVTVVVSKGPDVLPVPDVSGDSVTAASQALAARGFVVSGVSGNPTASVTGTNPAKGTVVRRGSSVQLITG